MQTYTIRELQNANSHRDGTTISAKSLTAAKRAATRSQMFLGTVMTVEQGGERVAIKENGKWHDYPDMFEDA